MPTIAGASCSAAGAAAVALSHRNAEAMVTESLGLILSWMGDPEALPTLRRAVQLSHEVGMKRFEMISLAGLADALRRSGARDEALALAREAWQLCVEVGAQAFAGPLALIEIAASTPDADEAEAALQQAEQMLARGAVAHNHLFGLPDAMRLRLAQGRHDEVLRLAGMLEAYAREEPTLWATHHVAAARALVRAAHDRGRGACAGAAAAAGTGARGAAVDERAGDRAGAGRAARRAQTVMRRALA